MNIYSIKPYFQKLLSPLFKLLILLRVHPNYINFFALFISIIAGISFLYTDQYNFLFIIIPFLLLLRIAFNALDGMVARKLNLSSKVGELYNELSDRLSDMVIFICLAFANYVNLTLMLILTCIILLNSYLGILGKASGGSRQFIGIMGKADRMLYLGIITIISFFKLNEIYWLIFTYFLITGCVISIIQRFFAIKKELNQ